MGAPIVHARRESRLRAKTPYTLGTRKSRDNDPLLAQHSGIADDTYASPLKGGEVPRAHPPCVFHSAVQHTALKVVPLCVLSSAAPEQGPYRSVPLGMHSSLNRPSMQGRTN